MLASKQPLVSICIPTFNGEHYLEDCLKSALAQNYNNIELIVSDDASNDDTLAIVNKIKKNTDIAISIFNHQPNGIGANWNNCIKHAHGDYIKFLFQDDLLEPNCIATLMNVMLTNTNVALVYAKRRFIYEEETDAITAFKNVYGKLHKYWADLEISHGVLDGKVYLRDKHFLNAPKNKIGEPTSVLIDKNCFQHVGFFNEELKQALDCEFWSRLMPHYHIGFVDEYLSSFRLHEAQASAVNKLEKINETEDLYKIYYNTILPYLHNDCRWKLKKRFHPLISKMITLKARFSPNG